MGDTSGSKYTVTNDTDEIDYSYYSNDIEHNCKDFVEYKIIDSKCFNEDQIISRAG